MLHHDAPVRRERAGPQERLDHARDGADRGVGRVHEDEVVGLRRGRGHCTFHRQGDDLRLALEPERLEVLTEGGERRASVLDERGARGAAGEGLDPEGAGAGVQVEHGGAVEVAERREERLAHPIARGPRGHPPRGREPAAAEAAGDHAHG